MDPESLEMICSSSDEEDRDDEDGASSACPSTDHAHPSIDPHKVPINRPINMSIWNTCCTQRAQVASRLPCLPVGPILTRHRMPIMQQMTTRTR